MGSVVVVPTELITPAFRAGDSTKKRRSDPHFTPSIILGRGRKKPEMYQMQMMSKGWNWVITHYPGTSSVKDVPEWLNAKGQKHP